jgi:putative ABC transport system permease protein
VKHVRRLSSIGSKSLAHRKGRSLLTGTGIVLGVAILFGVLVANATTQEGIDRVIEDITGRADVLAGPVGVFNADLPPGTLENLSALPDVQDAVGTYELSSVFEDRPSPHDPDQPAEVFVQGIVLEEARKIQAFELDEGRFPAPGAEEILLSAPAAADLAIPLGDTVRVPGHDGTRSLEVVGILDATGAGRSLEGLLAYTSIETARSMAGAPQDAYGGVALLLAEGTNIDEWIRSHRESVPGVQFQNAETLAQGFRDFAAIFGLFLTFFAAITLFVGAFLIYLTLSMAVIERTRLYGTLRALGASRKQVRRVVLTEATSLGAASTVVGLLLGLLLALGLLQLISSFFGVDMPGLVISRGAVIGAILVGLTVTVASALIPAVRAGRLAPIEAMKGDFARDTRLGRTWIAGAVIFLLALGLVVATGGSGTGLGGLGIIGILLGTVLMVPLLLRPMAALLGKLTQRLAPGVGDIAVLHLSKERSRSAYTLALIMVVMSMLFVAGGLLLSLNALLDDLLERQFGADLFVSPHTAGGADIEADLRGQPDVAAVSPMRFGFGIAAQDGERMEVFIRTIDPNSYFDVASYLWTDGSDDQASASLDAGGSVLLAEEVAGNFGLGRGDTLTLETTEGVATFEVASIYTGQFGPPEISMGIADARRHLSVGDPTGYIVDVADGADAAEVGAAIRSSMPEHGITFQTTTQLREQAASQLNDVFRIILAILAVAAIVGLLGLANTLAMSVLQRFREIGILRSVGVTKPQVRRMVLVESATMGIVAFILSLPLGWVLTFLVTQGGAVEGGLNIDTVYPWAWIPFVALFGGVIAVVAAFAPGRRAARLNVVEALQYE